MCIRDRDEGEDDDDDDDDDKLNTTNKTVTDYQNSLLASRLRGIHSEPRQTLSKRLDDPYQSSIYTRISRGVLGGSGNCIN